MDFDVITVGGGLAGSTFGAAMAKHGCKVLVLERERKFKDRVRGENMLPWGVAAARRLGIIDTLLAAGGHQPPKFTMYMMGNPVNVRDLRATTPDGEVSMNIYHPDMQEALLERARACGAEVRRGATVVSVDAGLERKPSVIVEHEGRRETLNVRVVVGADGKTSQMRAWAGFETSRDPDLLTIAGTLMDGTEVPDDAVHLMFGPGCVGLMAPLGAKKARTYFVYPGVTGRKGLCGKEKVNEFVKLCITAGMPEQWFTGAESIGPLAEFDGADRWVESPAKNGVALVGDAAASSDPSWGCGLSLTLIDVENLANALKQNDDWTRALDLYAKRHDEYYSALRRILGWMTELTWTPGAEGDARRAKVYPKMMAEPQGFPDSIGLGPFGPSDEKARRLVLGLDMDKGLAA